MPKTLYHLSPVLPLDPIWKTHDSVQGFVIRARNPTTARALASMNARDETGEAWRSPRLSTCEPISRSGPTTIILRDFRAG